MKLQICAVVLALSAFKFCDGTVCRPLSKFTIDCNTCRCDHSGLEYSCTNEICEPREDQYIRELTKEGYVLLRPRETHKKELLEEPDDFEFPRIRHHRIPYLNDEISHERGENDINNGLEKSVFLSAMKNVHSEDDDYVDDIELSDAIQK